MQAQQKKTAALRTGTATTVEMGGTCAARLAVADAGASRMHAANGTSTARVAVPSAIIAPPAQALDEVGGEQRHAALTERLPGSGDADREPRHTGEPVADRREERGKQRASTQRAREEEDDINLPERVRLSREQKAGAHHGHCDETECPDANAIRNEAHDDAADRQAKEPEAVDRRNAGAAPTLCGLNRDEEGREAIDESAHHHGEHEGSRTGDEPRAILVHAECSQVHSRPSGPAGSNMSPARREDFAKGLIYS